MGTENTTIEKEEDIYAGLDKGELSRICKSKIPYDRSLACKYPEIAKELDIEKNGFTAFEVMPGSHKKVWWRCKKGHSYEAMVYHRTYGTGCPYCSNTKILVGYNDLATTDPELALELDCEASGFKATDVMRGSGRPAWWI